jgi:CheY-like chemotaxis protein
MAVSRFLSDRTVSAATSRRNNRKLAAVVLACRRGGRAVSSDALKTGICRVQPTVYAARKAEAVPMRQSVFVVDDDPSVRTSMSRLLREHGFVATLFESASALYDHDHFDEAICIVLDINLDGSSGIDLRRKLAEKGVGAPVIYITGNDSAEHCAAAIASGCVAYLAKPFSAQSLIDAVTRAAVAA